MDIETFQDEIVQIYVGHAGIEIGQVCWRHFCLEHNINIGSGILDDFNPENPDLNLDNAVFSCGPTGKINPRTVMVDTESSAINDLRENDFAEFFPSASLISEKNDAGYNFGCGYYNSGFSLLKSTLDYIRLLVDNCSNFQGFIFYRSLGGGTGSGFGSKLMRYLCEDYPKSRQYEFIVYPSASISTAITEPYNAVLATHASTYSCDLNVTMENEALFDICKKQLDIESPNYANFNNLIGQIVSAFTLPMRFDGGVKMGFHDFHIQLVPFPRFHYTIPSYAPMVSIVRGSTDLMTIPKITNTLFSPSAQFVKCDPSKGEYMSAVLLYRGNLKATEINATIKEMKLKQSNFSQWISNKTRTALNFEPNKFVPWSDFILPATSVCMLGNNDCITNTWTNTLTNFDMMFKRKTFVHHYLNEGMEENDFLAAKEDMVNLVEEYQSADAKLEIRYMEAKKAAEAFITA